MRNFPSPVDFTDETNWTRTIIFELKTGDTITYQRKQLDNTIHARIINHANKTAIYVLEAAVAYAVSIGEVIGWQASKHSQTRLTAVD